MNCKKVNIDICVDNPSPGTVLWKYILISLLTALLFVSEVYPQNSSRVEYLTLKDGLVHNRIKRIIKDSNGFFWAGTDMGLCRYDGYTFIEIGARVNDSTSLSNSMISGLYEDNYGYFWIGTYKNGLYRYDPERESFTSLDAQFREVLESESFTINYIDGKGDKVYVATSLGAYEFSIESNPDSDIQKLTISRSLLESESITCLLVDHLDILWLGTSESGLYFFDERIDKMTVYNADKWPSDGISHNHVSCLIESPGGNMVIGTWGGGLNILYRSSGKIKTYNTELHRDLNSDFVYDLEFDHKGSIWLGTYLGSLYEIVNYENPDQIITLKEVVFDPGMDEIEIDDCSKVLCEDETGFLWIGTLGNGIKKYYPNINNIAQIEKDETKARSLNNNDVTVILEDHTGGFWLGTWGGGINYCSSVESPKRANEFTHFTHDPLDKNSISGNLVQCIFEDSENNIWIGTYESGLNKVNADDFTFEHFSCMLEEDGSRYSASIMSVFETSSGEKLIGTDRGLMKLNDDLEKADKGNAFLSLQTEFAAGVSSMKTTILTFLEYPENVLWLGTLENGLIKMLRDSSDFGWRYECSYLSGGSDKNNLSNNTIRSLLEDGQGNIWVGTHIGLNKFNPGTEVFQHFGIKDGLSNRNIGKLINDGAGNIWMGTELGINRLNIETNQIKPYVIPGEASKNDFNWGSGFRCENGMLCFGSNHGMVFFNPSNLTENTLKPPVVITDFQIANTSISLGEDEADKLHLPKSINYLDQIRLPYNWNTFSIEFSGLSHFLQEQNQYRFMLEGYHDTWIYTDYNSHIARFYNIPAGKYTLRIDAANNDGLWNSDGRELKIKILPPFWLSWWSYLVYLVLAGLIFYYARRITSARVKMKYELELERMKREKGEEVNQLKLKFFTSISHEFRTPLTLIIAPLEKLILSCKNNIDLSRQLLVINRNAKRLLYLVNELMDFRKIETGKLSFNPGSGYLHEIIDEVFSFFENYAVDRNINYSVNHLGINALAWFDHEMLEKVFINLLSNAFKYTDDYGSITIRTQDERDIDHIRTIYEHSYTVGDTPGDYFEISIEDSGIGIDKDQLAIIFDRFYQVQDEKMSAKRGTGIGLSLVKGFVLVHNGQIIVESTVGKGSIFRVRIPRGLKEGDENLFTELDDKTRSAKKYSSRTSSFTDLPSILEIEGEKSVVDQNIPSNHDKSSSLILIVEDNIELRKALTDHFCEKYRVIEAGDGDMALKMTVRYSPDLVISDVMMPVMDGMEYCRALRENIQISHTPIILLTADTDPNNRIQGIETGADAYIMKPFSFRFLDAKVHSLLESRSKLRELFSGKVNVQASEITVTSRDEKILARAIEFVEENISNENLGVDDLSSALGFSRSQLYRKLKNLTSLGPNEFIRSIRLKVAAQLLIKEKSSVSDTLYKVGFSNRSYFASCFKKEFGLAPKEYQDKYIEN